MISRTVKIQLTVFLVLAMGALLVTSTNYVGLTKRTYHVKAYFVNSGNIFTNAEVTYRGVTVGRVNRLDVGKNGIVVTLAIEDNNKHIPKNSRAEIQKLSAVGEQYVDILPQQSHGPYLKNHSSIPYAMTDTPVDENTVLVHTNDLVRTVPKDDLRTTVDELDNAFQGTGPDLQRLIDRGNEVIQSFQSNLPQTIQLIEESRVVLQTQTDVGPEFKSFAHDIADVSGTIRNSDADLRRLLDNGVVATKELQALFTDLRPELPMFLGNLITLGRIQGARLPGLDQVLILYPKQIDGGFSTLANPVQGARFGLVTDNFGVCQNGYLPKSQQTTAKDSDTNKPVRLDLACREPLNSPIDVRGSRNAPRPPGDTTDPVLGGYDYGNAGYQGSSDTSQPTGQNSTTNAAQSLTDRAAFDPGSGLVTDPDGKQYFLGADGGQASVLGAESWKSLLLAPLTS